MSTENIGRYKILSEIGQGGMATVFRAYDPNFERDVAIKVLPSIYLHDPQFRTRFEREAKMIASLEHPAIVPVYDFGEQDGQPYIVMRYMAGGSLAERLKQGQIPVDETLRIVSRLGPALDAAHARKIVHRDLKPGNILFDQYGNAFLSDFGIARLSQSDSITITGENILGTPTYMSPEQVQGEKTIDGRSDIYALGVLSFQMLTGQTPYKADTPTKLMMMHLLEPVPSILKVKNEFPVAVESVLTKSMAKSADERFATSGEFASSLEQALTGIQAAPAIQDGQVGQTVQHDIMKAETTIQPRTGSVETRLSPGLPAAKPAPGVKPVKRQLTFLMIGLIGLVLIIGSAIVIGAFYFIYPYRSGKFSAIQSETAQSESALISTSSLPAVSQTSEAIPPNTLPVLAATGSISETAEVADLVSSTETPAINIVGGADKIALIIDNDIWMANLDGTGLQRLTEDGTIKTELQWTPDGKSIKYIQGKCVQIVNIETGAIDNITCFNFVDFLRAFEISPDNQKVAVSLDNQLYIVPYDLERLKEVTIRSDLTEIAECKDLAPYQQLFLKITHWSDDSRYLASVVMGVSGLGYRADVILVFDMSTCTPDPDVIDHFPAKSRFTIKDYDKNPQLQSFTWDGLNLFALNSAIRNDGYGDLYIYNMELHKAQPQINPIDKHCCYRDPQWSPDGSYLAFAFQNMLLGSESQTEIYIAQYGTLGTGAKYTPLPLPAITDAKAKPQIILRPAMQAP